MQFCSFGDCAVRQPADVSFLLTTVLLLLLLCGVVCGVVICWLQGGATHFDHLGISVQPQQGMALLFFPSYANGTADPRCAGPAAAAAVGSAVCVMAYEVQPVLRLKSADMCSLPLQVYVCNQVCH
jgi:hypothetical protein